MAGGPTTTATASLTSFSDSFGMYSVASPIWRRYHHICRSRCTYDTQNVPYSHKHVKAHPLAVLLPVRSAALTCSSVKKNSVWESGSKISLKEKLDFSSNSILSTVSINTYRIESVSEMLRSQPCASERRSDNLLPIVLVGHLRFLLLINSPKSAPLSIILTNT